MTPPPPVLVAEGASKAYADLVALAPLDLTVEAGETVALVGHNGSGKSTFLRLAAGLLDLTDGAITVAGAPAGASDARAAISFLPDEPVLYDDLSVREHMAYVAALHGSRIDDDGIDAIIERVELGHRADDLPSRFSRGLRQKASIALGLVRPFRVLLVDEPFVGLDASGKAAFLDILDELRGSPDHAVLVATHDPNFVERADRCVALHDGEVVHDGPATPDEVLRLVSH
ncbi:MAG: ABC transporter ATP-binding protein [Acidimicrobiia bacterium]|nr:ABC transporter ATP-binding protein [Acidimicrobiia bacterium]